MSILPHQNAKRTFVEAEFHRAIAHQFAVDFDRHDLIALDADLAGLEIFNLRHTNVGTKYYILQIFDDLEITESLEDNDVQKAIVDYGVFKEWKRAAIQATVTDEDERTFVNRRIFGLNEEPGRLARGDLSR